MIFKAKVKSKKVKIIDAEIIDRKQIWRET
jgi:hypothetical protein